MYEDDLIKALIHRLSNFNEWRRGGEMAMPNPVDVGVDIDVAIALLKNQIESKD